MTSQPENSSTPNGTYGSSPDRGVLDEALEPEQIRSLNSALRKLSRTDSVGKDLEDAAKRLLSGRLALRDALDDPAVARALTGGGMASLRGQWDSLPEDERDRIRHEEPAAAETSANSPEPRRPLGADSQSARKTQGRHSGGFSLY
ncbi:hypothetical protein OK074_5761 [Actinobacteria bacterium OK074]|nr:hypothetical protein OK074_5761 [Actinobacteria bacterium OK074]